jgi:hypothetical protein
MMPLIFLFGLAALVIGAELLSRGASKLILSSGTLPLVVVTLGRPHPVDASL